MSFPLLFLVVLPTPNPAADPAALVARLDALMAAHWQAENVKPALPADDSTFLRRLTLDLAGRVPTYQEATAFAADRSPEKRARAVRRLMDGPEYPLQLGRVLDEIIQDRFAGDGEFLEYLRGAVAEHRPWDRIFCEVLLGPWDTPAQKRALGFLARRLNSLDDLTNDTARAFFGVNVSCAKCHDHPLVADWTQDHYFGMASFLNPTYEGSKGKRGAVSEKDADLTYVSRKGERRPAKTMFLSGRILDKPAAAAGRRELLVQVALEEKGFFSRSIVNRLWSYFLGRGLVQPVDQMHSANPPAVPGVLELLADDLAIHGYDLDRLVAVLVSSRAYQLVSLPLGGDGPAEQHFGTARLRPLTPQQFALSVVLAAGDATFDQAAAPEARAKRYRELEGQAATLVRPGVLDPRGDRFQSSTGEALFLSNGPEVQRLVNASGSNLAARLSGLADSKQLVELAVWTVLGRPPEDEERAYLAKWLEGKDRRKACGELVWALLASAEFRFNH